MRSIKTPRFAVPHRVNNSPGGITLQGLGIPLTMKRRLTYAAFAVTIACGDGIPERNSPSDSLMTVRYVELLRAELTAADHMEAYKAVQCEMRRVRRVVTRKHGNTYALGVLEGAERRALEDVPDAMIRRRDERHGLTLPSFSDEDCIPLAKAGVLGDTVFPPPVPLGQ